FLLNTGPLTVSTATATGGGIRIGTHSQLTIAGQVRATVGDIHLNAGESLNSSDDLRILTGATVTAAAGAVTFGAGASTSIEAGASVRAPTGPVRLDLGVNDVDGAGGAVLSGSLSSPAPVIVQGGASSDTIVVNSTAAGEVLVIDGGAGSDSY